MTPLLRLTGVGFRTGSYLSKHQLHWTKWHKKKKMGIPDHLTCLLRNLYAGQEATVRTDMEQQTGSKSGKDYVKAVYYKESWALRNWCFWTVVLEETPESPLDCKEMEPVPYEGDQPWVFFGGNDAKAEAPVLWPPHVRHWLIGKDSDAGRDWGQEEKGTTEDEMAGWHHWLNANESEWIPGDGDGQGGLACCNSCDRKESDMTEWMNWTKLNWKVFILIFFLLSKLTNISSCSFN